MQTGFIPEVPFSHIQTNKRSRYLCCSKGDGKNTIINILKTCTWNRIVRHCYCIRQKCISSEKSLMPLANFKKSLDLTQTSVLKDAMLFVHLRNILLNWNNFCRIGVLQILTVLPPVQSSLGVRLQPGYDNSIELHKARSRQKV